MRNIWLYAAGFVVAGTLLGAGVALEPLHAQQQQQWPGIRVAVINVSKVLKSYNKFKELEDQLKRDYESKENDLRAMQQVLVGKRDALQKLKNPADRDRLEKEMSDLQFEFAKKQRTYREEFLSRQAESYNTVYKELSDLLAKYCERNNIHIVLRLDDTKSDTNDPQMVIAQVFGKQVIYHHQNLDLSDVIGSGLNEAMAMNQK